MRHKVIPLFRNVGPLAVGLTEVAAILGIAKAERDLHWSNSPWVFSGTGEGVRTAFENACEASQGEADGSGRAAVRNMTCAGVSCSVAMRISDYKTEAVLRRSDITAEADLLEAAEKLEPFMASRWPRTGQSDPQIARK